MKRHLEKLQEAQEKRLKERKKKVAKLLGKSEDARTDLKTPSHGFPGMTQTQQPTLAGKELNLVIIDDCKILVNAPYHVSQNS
jgi:hypothetical protein